MVGDPRGRGRGDAGGGIASPGDDNEWSGLVRTAAIGALAGVDPHRYAASSGAERLLWVAVIREAEDMRARRLNAVIEAIGAAVQNGVARAFGG